ncbi:ABC transporter ATP-binding protein [Rhizobium sp. Root1204]|uniref:ATP-binding cassette domain-containing protein n=1 Tax=Rhizobium sp. Root1204 TaxID=1736428 RepID=UPI0007138D05|nr:ABC transporter ATP-binding protein [Rhizobium sp. Root1204]KQV36358.1 hypothetical protein ASC96_28220 [Rhizobium sp. Root1204]
MIAEPILSVRNLSVSLSRDGFSRRVLDNLTFDVMPGEILAIVGESGSGKSTLGATIQGLIPFAANPKISGSARLDGLEVVGAKTSQLRTARRSIVRSISQDPLSALNPTMPIGRQLKESVVCDDTFIAEWLRAVGLGDVEDIAARLPHCLSGGQRQRTCIAMAMMAHPKLLIADEPTTALDSPLQVQILDLIRQLAKNCNTAVLFITHNLGAAAKIADRLLVLCGGEIVEIGNCNDVLLDPQHPHTKQLVAAQSAINVGGLTTVRARRTPAPFAVLQIEHVWFTFAKGLLTRNTYKETSVLRSINLTIDKGESVALVGGSGSGKTTLVRLAAGLLAPTAGQVIRHDGRNPQVVFQDPVTSLTPWLTVGEQISERLRPLRLDPDRRNFFLDAAMESVGLDRTVLASIPSELSVGQCQRVSLARAVIVPPELLLCDEPTSALDTTHVVATLNIIAELRARLGMAVLFVTHDMVIAHRVSDRVITLRDGELTAEVDHPASSLTKSATLLPASNVGE